MRFSRCRATQEAARGEIGFEEDGNGVRGAYQILYNYLSVLMWCAMILSSPAIGRNAQGRVASQVASPRRPRFAVGRLRTPVRSEIGTLPDRTLRGAGGTRDDAQASGAVFGCGYAALRAMQARILAIACALAREISRPARKNHAKAATRSSLRARRPLNRRFHRRFRASSRAGFSNKGSRQGAASLNHWRSRTG